VVLVHRLALLLAVLAGCSQSLFDANGPGAGGGGDGSVTPATCPAPCVADAAADFDGSPGGAGGRWRYLDDHRDRTWKAMAASATAMTGEDPANHISTCAKNPSSEACRALPGALLVSSSGATSMADPAIELTSATSQVIQLSVRARSASGDPQQIRIYRNSREDELYTGTAMAGTTLEQALTLDAIAGDRFLVAVAPIAGGATDVALHVFVNTTGASFPSTCQVALPFSAAAGNTVDNLCGADYTHTVFSGGDTPPTLTAGPYPELGKGTDLISDNYFASTGSLNRSGDTTVQFWVKLRSFVDVYDAWLFSDLNLDDGAKGGLGIAILNRTPRQLDVETCTNGTTLTFANAQTPYPPDESWQFVRVVHTGGNVQICLNGKRQTSFAAPAGSLQSTYPPYLGKNVRWTPSGAFFDGVLDDVRVISGALPCN